MEIYVSKIKSYTYLIYLSNIVIKYFLSKTKLENSIYSKLYLKVNSQSII